jgi:hypothetical protein
MLATACDKQNAHAVAAAGPDGTQSVEIDVSTTPSVRG